MKRSSGDMSVEVMVHRTSRASTLLIVAHLGPVRYSVMFMSWPADTKMSPERLNWPAVREQPGKQLRHTTSANCMIAVFAPEYRRCCVSGPITLCTRSGT